MVRASEAAFVDPRASWAFQAGSVAANWLSSNVARIFSDDAILVEGARTNICLDSRDPSQASWTAGSGATTTTGHADGPDGASGTGTRMQCTSGGLTKYKSQLSLTTALDYVASLYARQSSGGPAAFEGGMEHTAVVGAPWAPLSLAATWTRRTTGPVNLVGGDTTTSVVPADGRTLTAIGSTASAEDVTIDLIQLEQASFASSPIRTTGSTGTRAADNVTLASGDWADLRAANAWSVEVWPEWPSTNAPASGTERVVFDIDANRRLIFYFNGSAWEVRFYANRAASAFSSATCPTFARHAHLRIYIDQSTGELTVENIDTATSNSDASPAGAGDWSSATTLFVGQSAGGTGHLFGVIAPPGREL